MQRVLSSAWRATLALATLLAACQRSAPAASATEKVDAEPGLTYVNTSAAQRTTIRVKPHGVVSWTRESIAASGISTSIELRWKAKQSPLVALSSSLYQASGQWEGAIGARDSVQRWRSVRISSGGSTPTLTAPARGAELVAALEQQLLGALNLEQSERYQVLLPIRTAAEAVARCHAADRAVFQVAVVANAETGDYHEQISDERAGDCVGKALADLRQSTRVHGRPGLGGGAMENGGRIELRRGSERALAGTEPPPEVPRDETTDPEGPRRLERFELPTWPPRRSHYVVQPNAQPGRGEVVALELRLWVGSRPGEPRDGPIHIWRFRVRHDQNVSVAWQRWRGHGESYALEVALDLQPDPALVSALFEQARSLRLNEREHWQCGTTMFDVHTDDDGDAIAREAAARAERLPNESSYWGRRVDTSCRILGMAEQLKTLLNTEVLGAALERAVAPALWGMRDCGAKGLNDADAVLELSGPQSRPALSARATWRAVDARAASNCVRTALGGFEVPAELREVWQSGKLRVVLRRSGAAEHKGLVEEAAPQDPVEVARAQYKTRW